MFNVLENVTHTHTDVKTNIYMYIFKYKHTLKSRQNVAFNKLAGPQWHV